MDDGYFFVIAILLGLGVMTLLFFGGGGIPPTPAFLHINTETDNQNVTALNSADIVYFVSDGSLNITRFVQQQANWCNAEYDYRKSIMIESDDVPNENMTNFVLMLSITDSDLASRARSDGNDIIFCDTTHTTKLNHDLDVWTKATGELIAWINVPTVFENADTEIWMYYDNSGETSATENEDLTWNSDYLGVYHFQNDLLDASGNGNDGSLSSGVECYIATPWGVGYRSSNESPCAGYSQIQIDPAIFQSQPYTQPLIVAFTYSEKVNSGTTQLLFEVDDSTPYRNVAVYGGLPANYLLDANSNIIQRRCANITVCAMQNGAFAGGSVFIKYDGTGLGWDSVRIVNDNFGEATSYTNYSNDTLDSDITTVHNSYLCDGSRVDRCLKATIGEQQLITANWSIDYMTAHSNNLFDPDSFIASIGSEIINPSIGFIPDRIVNFTLNTPTATSLGGVYSVTCSDGLFISQVLGNGTVVCETLGKGYGITTTGTYTRDTDNEIDYVAWGSTVRATSEANADWEIHKDITVTRFMMHVNVYSNTGTDPTVTIRDDGADLSTASNQITATGFYDSGAISESISSGSMVSIQLDKTGSVGLSWNIASMIIEWEYDV